MDDKQQEFQQWLADKLQAKDMDDLKQKVQQMGEDGIRQAYDQFMQENTEVQSNKLGGKLQYMQQLQAFKKGGSMSMKKCATGDKMEDGGMLSKKGYKRKDINVKEKNPGAKDRIGKNTKKEHTAVGGVKEFQGGGSMLAMNRQNLSTTNHTNHAPNAVSTQPTAVPNWTKTTDPNVYMGRYGVPIRRSDWQATLNVPTENKNLQTSRVTSTGQTHFNTFEDYADYYGSQKPQATQDSMIQKQMLAQKQQQMLMSEKARGLSNVYEGPTTAPHADIPMLKPSPGYRAVGGTITKIKYGERNDGAAKQWTPQGKRNDGGKKEHSAVGGNKSLGKMVNKGNGERKDIDKKETNPGSKDRMSKGEKKWTTALTKVPKAQQGNKLAGGQAQPGK